MSGGGAGNSASKLIFKIMEIVLFNVDALLSVVIVIPAGCVPDEEEPLDAPISGRLKKTNRIAIRIDLNVKPP